MADETGEVRSLLMRHRLSIVRDLIGTSLVQVLLKAGVLTAAQEEQLTGEPSLDARCDQLIELIARDGFEKFKQFCYAIESECSQLISDLINDKLSQAEDDGDSAGYDAGAINAGSVATVEQPAIVQPPVEASFAVTEAKTGDENEYGKSINSSQLFFPPSDRSTMKIFLVAMET
uniref:CARD domain-containing protein n=1 Tax=Anopheles culicifacies TaxID=139723 RepID=A0A182MKR8_9DIPT